MDKEINEYCEMLWVSGINISGWSLIHNCRDIPEGRNGFYTLYATDFGGMRAIKNEQLKSGQFFIVPPNIEIVKRCECCGQVIK